MSWRNEEAADLAEKFLLAEPPEERRGLMKWALREFDRMGLTILGAVRVDANKPGEFVMDLIRDNPLIDDWMRARLVSTENLENAEDFRDFIDRLTPAYHDE